jgi:ribosomal protein S18 acetylase RimI-like enzyme
MIHKLQHKNKDIARKIRSVFQISYAVEAKLLSAVDFPPLKRKLVDFIESNNTFFGVFLNDALAGVIEIKKSNTSVHIQSLVVAPKFFRQGIGRKLTEYILNSYDSKIFTVETGVKNKPATELYKKLGFVEVKQWETDHGVRKVRFEIKEKL